MRFINLDDKDSCKNYIAAVCSETVKLLSEENLPPAPDYDLLCRAVEKFSAAQKIIRRLLARRKTLPKLKLIGD